MNGGRLARILEVARYEVYREVNKRSIWVIIILLLMPLIVSLIIRGLQSESLGRDPLMWAIIMGVDAQRALTLGAGTLTGALSVISWSWLIAILYGGDLFAADMQDGSIQMILSRPIRRSEYVLAKYLAASLVMIAVFTIAGVGIVLAAWILAGPQDRVLEAIFLSSLIGVGILPLLGLAALIGLKTGKPVLGMVLGLLVWFIGQLVLGAVSVYYVFQGDPQRALEMSNALGALLPFLGGDNLSMMLYSRLHGVEMTLPMSLPNGTIVEVTVSPGDYLWLGVAGLIAWVVGVVAVSWLVLSRKDL